MAAGLAVTLDGSTLVVANINNDSVSLISRQRPEQSGDSAG